MELTRPLTPNELKTLRLKQEEIDAKEARLKHMRREEREIRDKARRAGQNSARRAAAEARIPGVDKRWGWLQDEQKQMVDIRVASYPGACIPVDQLAPERRPRRNSARSQSPGQPRSASPRGGHSPRSPSISSRRMQRLAHHTQTVASKCRVTGDGLHIAITRQFASFTIEAFDASGNRRAEGGDAFAVSIKGSSVVSAKIFDNGDGSYVCEHRASVSGAYTINITLHGVVVADSPYALNVIMPRPEASRCVLRGSGLSFAVAREPASFEIDYVDAFGQVAFAEEVDVHVER